MQRILTEQLWERIVQKFQVSHSQAIRFLAELEEEEKAEVIELRAKLAAADEEIRSLRAKIAVEWYEAPKAEAKEAPKAEAKEAPKAEVNEVEAQNEPKEVADSKEACSALLKSGEKKGETCGKKCAAGSDRCPSHARAAVAEGEACEYVFGKGPKKDTVCGKKRCADSPFCSEHQSKPKESSSKPKEKSAPKADAEVKPAEEQKPEAKEEQKSDEPKSDEPKSDEPKPKAPKSPKKSAPKEEKPKKSAPKEEKPKEEKPKEEKPKEEKPAIRAVRRGALVVIKGTDLVIDSEGATILGHAVLTGETWELVAEWVPVMEEAMRTYDLACALEH